MNYKNLIDFHLASTMLFWITIVFAILGSYLGVSHYEKGRKVTWAIVATCLLIHSLIIFVFWDQFNFPPKYLGFIMAMIIAPSLVGGFAGFISRQNKQSHENERGNMYPTPRRFSVEFSTMLFFMMYSLSITILMQYFEKSGIDTVLSFFPSMGLNFLVILFFHIMSSGTYGLRHLTKIKMSVIVTAVCTVFLAIFHYKNGMEYFVSTLVGEFTIVLAGSLVGYGLFVALNTFGKNTSYVMREHESHT